MSDPVRLAIVRALHDRGEQACGALEVPVSRSTLSHHLKVLRDAGLTLTRAEGVHRFVSLRRADIEDRFPGLLTCVLSHADARPGSRHRASPRAGRVAQPLASSW
jgi:DNA-binding transcriptional ArsR family regulator